MEEAKKQFWTGLGVGAAAGGIAGFAAASLLDRGPRALPSGAARHPVSDRDFVEAQIVSYAALVASAQAWADQLEEVGRSRVISGRNIMEEYESLQSARPNAEIKRWVQVQMDRWKKVGGLDWATGQIFFLKGDTLRDIAYRWILEVQGDGVGLWEEYRNEYPKPPLSEIPYVRFKLSPATRG